MCMRLRHMQLHGNAQSIPNPKYWGVVYVSYNVGGVTTMDLLTSLNIIIGRWNYKSVNVTGPRKRALNAAIVKLL